MPTAGSEGSGTLVEELANALPEGSEYQFYHISTPPSRCAPLYSPPQGAKPERTYCESHFLNVAIRSNARNGDSDDEYLVLAIEILVFSTRSLTTVFVSKADSTGFLSLAGVPKSHPSPLRTVTTTFLTHLSSTRRRPGRPLVLSLFARAQDQYLFPGSAENSAKHISTDRELIKWWCRVADPLLRQESTDAQGTAGLTDAQAYILVPGEDSTASFLPPSVRSSPELRRAWKQGHPLHFITSHPGVPPRCLVPHFPDDPKARFVDELDAELLDGATAGASQHDSPSKRGRGMWKSVRSLDQFWEMMAFRQECSSGRLVGFLWLVFTSSKMMASQQSDDAEGSQASVMSAGSGPRSPSSPAVSAPISGPLRRGRKPLTGPIIPRMPRIKHASSDALTNFRPERTPYYIWPASSRGTLVLDEKDYKRAVELLLKLDFATAEVAASSTKHWVDQIGVYGTSGQWGRSVRGRKPAVSTNEPEAQNGVSMHQPKRKAEASESSRAGLGGANVLGAALIRKKPKVDSPVSHTPRAAEENGTPGVNVLSAGLVRKKPKI